jgi:hypothetical protein
LQKTREWRAALLGMVSVIRCKDYDCLSRFQLLAFVLSKKARHRTQHLLPCEFAVGQNLKAYFSFLVEYDVLNVWCEQSAFPVGVVYHIQETRRDES